MAEPGAFHNQGNAQRLTMEGLRSKRIRADRPRDRRIAVPPGLSWAVVKAKIIIPAALVFVVLAGAAAWAVLARVPQYLISGHRCSDAEAQFAESLTWEPLLTQPPQGVSPISEQPNPEAFQPCEGNGDNRYYGGALRGFDLPETTPTLDQIETHYRNVAAANGWELTKPAADELVGKKMIDGTAVVCSIYQLEHGPYNTAYWVEIRYAELRSSRYLLTIEDTF